MYPTGPAGQPARKCCQQRLSLSGALFSGGWEGACLTLEPPSTLWPGWKTGTDWVGDRDLPDDHDDSIEDVVGIPDVAQRAAGQQLQQHFQGEHAGEHDIADL